MFLKMFLSFSIIFFSFFMFFFTHPLSMGFMILLQTLLICLLSGLMMNSYWFSYILFLTFLGGLLVLFIYVSSIASNEIFMTSFLFNKKIFFIIIINFSISFMLFNNFKWMNFYFNYDMFNFFYKFLFFNNEFKMNLSKLYNNQTFLMMMILIIYLFITLVAIVKITNIFYGPLRSSF